MTSLWFRIPLVIHTSVRYLKDAVKRAVAESARAGSGGGAAGEEREDEFQALLQNEDVDKLV